MTPSLTLGAPGIYVQPPTPLQALTGVRMDVCAFLGVAPRGPARVPVVDEHWPDPGVEVERPRLRSVAVAVESWDEYRRLYGSYEGRGLLPFSVASFFEEGGSRAYVVRIVHDYRDPALDREGVAGSSLSGLTAHSTGQPPRFVARSEGSWGNRLRLSMDFVARPLRFDPEASTSSELVVEPTAAPAVGSLLRLSLGGGHRILRFVTAQRVQPRLDRWGHRSVLILNVRAAGVPVRAEVVEAVVDVDDLDPLVPRPERHAALGLSSDHPRWLGSVLSAASELIEPDPAWFGDSLVPRDVALPTLAADPFTGGLDRHDAITPDDFFDPEWVPGDTEVRTGVHCLLEVPAVASVVAADLYSPKPLPSLKAVVDVAASPGSVFAACESPEPLPQGVPLPELDGLRLDPSLPDELAQIAAHQARLVSLAEQTRAFVVLLDVPPGLHQRQILAWRAGFASTFAAGYHPWIRVVAAGGNALAEINPSAVAAGIIARRENAFGVPFGPANEISAGAVDLTDGVSAARHDELHQSDVNVYLRERDGIRLTAARTLGADPDYRQLSVRRLVNMLRRVLERQTTWMVFEPNTEALRAKVRRLLESYLHQLFLAGAFVGATDEQAFFVRCDDILNPRAVVEAGKLVVEVGIAPAEPLEFIVLRISRDGDSTVRVEDVRGP